MAKVADSQIAAAGTDAGVHPPTTYIAHPLELYLLGILVVGKVFSFWTSAFTLSYWVFFQNVSIVAVAYLCFVSSVAEMASLLPFSGGSYGYVRCVLGPFVGYMIGFFESLEYIMFVAACLVAFGRILAGALETPDSFTPVYWLIFYAIALPVNIVGGSLFWKVGSAMAAFIIVLILVYCFGNVGVATMTADRAFAPSKGSFLEFFAVAGWCFKGIELMTLSCEHVAQPAKTVPRAMMATIGTMVVLVMSIVVIAGSIQPGPAALVTESFPLNPGITRLLALDPKLAPLLYIPGVLGSTYCFFFAASTQLQAMASSGLMPPALKIAVGPNRTPALTLLIVTLLSLAIEVSLYYGCPETYLGILFTLSMMSSLPVYLSLMVSYCIYHDRFSTMDRAYRSPLGKWGAFYAMLIYGFAAVTLVVFPKEVKVSTSVFVSTSVLAMVYYFAVAGKRQFFSKEEQDKFLKVYVVNANQRKHAQKKSRRTLSHSGSSNVGVVLAMQARVFNAVESFFSLGGAGGRSMSHGMSKSSAVALQPALQPEEQRAAELVH